MYTQEANSFDMTLPDGSRSAGSTGLGGKLRVEVGSTGNFLTAIEAATGKIAWRRKYPSSDGGGIGLLATGRIALRRWQWQPDRVRSQRRQAALATRVGNIGNSPQTFMVDGRQYLLVGTGDQLWAFNLY